MESTRRKINGIRFFFPSRLLSLHCSYMEEIGEILKICNGFIFLFFSFSGKVEKDTTTIEYFFFFMLFVRKCI